MERLVDDMARLQEDVKSRVSITSTQLAEFKLSRASDTARDSRERAMFVVENSLSVNRMLKEFHDSRIANGLQDRADRIAFVSDMVKKRAEFLEKLSATRNGSLKDIANESAAKIADNATSVAALIKEGTGHTYGDATGRLAATKTPEPAIDAGVITAEVNARLLNTQTAPSTATKATVSVAPKTDASVTPKTGASVTSKTGASVTPKTAASVTPKTAASVTPKTAASVTPKTAASVTPKTAASVTPKTTASVTPKTAEPLAPEAAEPVTPKAGAHVTPKASAPKRVKSRRNR
ncbi:MAG: hypothetical protein ACI8Y3_001354 [Paraglaciecola sp.]|jgi:hypothetical protein